MNLKLFLTLLFGVLISSSTYYLINKNNSVPETLPTEQTQTTEPLTVLSGQEKTTGETSTAPKENINQVTETKKIMNAILHTNKGDITIAFNPATPNTVENFIKLAKEGFYDGTKFHRVIKGFMSQGGDPLSKDDSQMARWGTGGPGYAFNDELGPTNHNAIGTMAMANSGPNTNGSQFFINAADNGFLDTKHVVFAMVTAGADVVTAINNVPTGQNDRPVDPVIITSIDLK